MKWLVRQARRTGKCGESSRRLWGNEAFLLKRSQGNSRLVARYEDIEFSVDSIWEKWTIKKRNHVSQGIDMINKVQIR